jgi:metallo-beta-lactamase class B
MAITMKQSIFNKRCVMLLLAAGALTSCTSPDPISPVSQAVFPPIKKACGERDGWSDAAPPQRVFANVYMVGTCGIVSLLITTPKGHFLIDGATKEAAAGIADNIRSLGFDPKDVRYILGTHEHLDHVGGLAELKRITSAKFVTRSAAKAAMESGKPDSTDPQLGSIPEFEGIKADAIIADGETLRLGNQALTLIATPGHTPGGSSYSWKSCAGGICHNFVYADSLGSVSADAYRFSDHPAYVEMFRGSMARVAAIKNCDILISPHPFQSDFFERLAGEKPLVDSKGCASYAGNARQRLEARLTKEASK